MNIVMILLLFAYTATVIFVTRKVVESFIREDQDEIQRMRDECDDLLDRQKTLDLEKKRLEKDVTEIFALYDLTKEITKNFSEEDAFMTFKAKLRQSIAYEDCLLMDPREDDAGEVKDPPGYLMVDLKGQQRQLGTLALKGVRGEEKEKVQILANQFALALRRIRLYQELEKLAITDGLTDLYTRRYVLDRLEEERRRALSRKASVAFLMLDVDHFKHANDQYGHLVGDQILREIAEIMRDHIREIDIAGRYGGEEFCIILPDTDRSGAFYAAERIRSAIEKTTIKAYDVTVNVTISIGLAIYPQDGKKTAELIDKADGALYRAKNLGRNRVCTVETQA